MENKDLKISQLIPADNLDGREILPFAKDDANGSVLISLLKDYIINGLAKQSAVDGKQNKLIAGQGIQIGPDNVISSTLDTSILKVVDSLPTSDIESKIYLVVDPESTADNNVYIEYIHVNGRWEQVGKYTAKVDLSEYLKTTLAESMFAKKTDIPDISGLATSDDLKEAINNHKAEIILKADTSTVNSIKSNLQTEINKKCTMQEVESKGYLTEEDTAKFAKSSEIPDMTGYVSMATFNKLVSRVVELETFKQNITEKLKSIPVFPATDGNIYAMLDGEWVAIAEVGELIATVNAEPNADQI